MFYCNTFTLKWLQKYEKRKKKNKKQKRIHYYIYKRYHRTRLKLNWMLYLNTHIEGTGNKAEAFLLLIYATNSVRYLRLISFTNSGQSRASSLIINWICGKCSSGGVKVKYTVELRRTVKGNERQFELARVRVIGLIGVDWIFNLPC